jgi:hypothetical protein
VTLDFNHSAFREPTLCTVGGGRLYTVAAAQWGRFGDQPQAREPPVVLVMPIDRSVTAPGWLGS